MAVKSPLIGLALVVVGGVAALIVLLASGNDERADASEAPQSRADADAGRRAAPEPFPPAEQPEESGRTTRERPQIETSSQSGEDAEDDEGAYREYRRDDGTRVRDHREDAEDREPGIGGLQDPRQLPPTAEKVDPDTVVALRGALRPEVRRCVGEHAPEAEAGSALRARVTFSVASEQLAVDDAETTTRGLEEGSALEDCVRSAAQKVSLSVSGAQDVEGHPVDLPFRVGAPEN